MFGERVVRNSTLHLYRLTHKMNAVNSFCQKVFDKLKWDKFWQKFLKGLYPWHAVRTVRYNFVSRTDLTIATGVLQTFISIYPILKSEPLSVGTKLTLYKKLIISVLTYTWPAWEFAADSHLLTLQSLQNKVLRTICNFPSSAGLPAGRSGF